MTRSRADLMVDRLRNMQAAAPDIEASAVVSVDGLIMASALQQGVEEDRVSAMSAAMLSLGERISNELGRAGLEQVYIKGDKGSIVLTSIGEEAGGCPDRDGTSRGKTGYDLSGDAACSRRSRETGWMKTKNYQPLTNNAIPDGEGFIALPISFVYITI
jgi:predicted regulator of Ras-like GTPase activity (Roadblock/LC7/MglB family)